MTVLRDLGKHVRGCNLRHESIVGDHDRQAEPGHTLQELGESKRKPHTPMARRIAGQGASMESNAVPGQPLHERHRGAIVEFGLVIHLCWRIVKIAVGVSCPGMPDEIVDTPIGTPFLYTNARCAFRLTIIVTGPSGAICGAQKYSPGFSFSIGPATGAGAAFWRGCAAASVRAGMKGNTT